MRVRPFIYGSVVLSLICLFICHFLLKHLEQGDTQGELFEDEDEEDYVSLVHCDDNLNVMDCSFFA